MENSQYLQQLAPRGSNLYYSTLWLPAAQKRPVVALWGFVNEAMSLIYQCREYDVAIAKLQWWQQQLVTPNPNHPLLQTLQTTSNFNLTALLPVLMSVANILQQRQIQSLNELQQFAAAIGGTIGQLQAQILGINEQNLLTAAADVGASITYITTIQDLKKQLANNYCLLPLTATNDDIAIKSEVIKAAAIAQHIYKQSCKNLKADKRAKSLLILAHLYHQLLHEIAAGDYKVLEYSIELTPLRKLWLAWRANL